MSLSVNVSIVGAATQLGAIPPGPGSGAWQTEDGGYWLTEDGGYWLTE